MYNGKELQTDLNLDWYDYGARMYDAAIGRFHTIDRFNEKYEDYTPYHFTLNNPINFIDINGDSTWVYSRALDFPGGGAAVHTFIVAKPDDDPHGSTYYISFYEDDEGNLVGTEKWVATETDENGEETESVETTWGDENWNTDQEWDEDNLKGRELIDVPEGMTDSEFISNIRKEARTQNDQEYEYKAITTEKNCATGGNCNSSTTTILRNSGVPLERIQRINPSGYNPGLGIVNPRRD